MILEVIQRAFFGLPASAWSIIVPIFGFILTLISVGYWAHRTFDQQSTRKQSLRRWFQKPSFLLMLLALLAAIWAGSPNIFTLVLLILAFVLRHWEKNIYADIRVNDADPDRSSAELHEVNEKIKDDRSENDESG